MAHRLVVLLCVLSTLVYATTTESAGNKEDGAIKFEVGGKTDKSDIKSLFTTMNNKTPDDSESGDGSGGDDSDDIYSGSGSGQPDDEVVEWKTSPPTRKTTKTKSESTIMVIKEVTDKPTNKETTDTTTDSGNVIKTNVLPTEDPGNTVGASVGEREEDQPGVDFTVGIIVGVVVGAILAILVIVFLVYRLRKKDEGSYSLDEQSSQAFIRDEKSGGGQGKEYFA